MCVFVSEYEILVSLGLFGQIRVPYKTMSAKQPILPNSNEYVIYRLYTLTKVANTS